MELRIGAAEATRLMLRDTGVQHDFQAVARISIERMLDVDSGREATPWSRVAPELVIRDSTSPPRTGERRGAKYRRWERYDAPFDRPSARCITRSVTANIP